MSETEKLMPSPPERSDLDDVVRFLDHQLRPAQQWSIRAEYPGVFTAANAANMRVIRDGERWIAHAVYKPLLIKGPYGLLKVAALGSVVTSPDYRQQGLSRQTINSCLESASQQACDIAILWSDLHDFYRKLGFELAGTEIALNIDERFAPPDHGFRIETGRKVSAEMILRLATQHTVSSVRKLQDVQLALDIPNSRFLTAWNDKDELVAYAVEGKGLDLQNHFHEWAGSVKALLSLFRHHIQKTNQPLRVIAPIHAQNLIRQMELAGARSEQGFLGMVKILNPAMLYRKVNSYLARAALANIRFEWSHEHKTLIHADGDTYVTPELSDITKLLFGPSTPTQFDVFSPEVSQRLARVFPMPFWIWGWDSV